MIELIKLYWKVYRIRVAIIATVIIIGTNLLRPEYYPEPFTFIGILIFSLQNIGLYLIMTPVIMGIYYLYKKQQIERNPGIKVNAPEIFNRDTFFTIYTGYAVFTFIVSLFIDNIFNK